MNNGGNLPNIDRKLPTTPNAKLLSSLSTLLIAIITFGVLANELMMPAVDMSTRYQGRLWHSSPFGG